MFNRTYIIVYIYVHDILFFCLFLILFLVSGVEVEYRDIINRMESDSTTKMQDLRNQKQVYIYPLFFLFLF